MPAIEESLLGARSRVSTANGENKEQHADDDLQGRRGPPLEPPRNARCDRGRKLGWAIEVKPLAGRLFQARWTSRLARHAVAEVDDSRAEGAGLDEFEIHPALSLGKERNATAN